MKRRVNKQLLISSLLTIAVFLSWFLPVLADGSIAGG